MSYSIKLTDGEIADLSWAVNHGYFPKETYHAMDLSESEAIERERAEEYGATLDQNREWTYEIPEHAAWAISMQYEENPESLFACMGGNLLSKLRTLQDSII